MDLKPSKEKISQTPYFKWSLSFLIVLCIGIGFYYLLHNFSTVSGLIQGLIEIMTPFIIGGVVAYLLNPVLKLLERRLKKVLPNQKVLRAVSMVLTYLLMALVVWGLLDIVLPKLVDSIVETVGLLVVFVDKNTRLLVDWVTKSDFSQYFSVTQINQVSRQIETMLQGGLTSLYGVAKQIIPGLLDLTSSLTRLVFNLFLGIMVSIYLLLGKETLGAQIKKALFALFKKEKVDKGLAFLTLSHEIFGSFMVGVLIDSSIVGVITFVLMNIFGLPYALLISVLVGVTNVIPYFGPFIGAIPSGIILLTVKPLYALIFIIMILALQQIDGNIIQPIILGDTTGLSGIWILVAVTVGGGLFGLPGMVLGVPVCAVLYATFVTWSNRRLQEKGLETALSAYTLKPWEKKKKKKSGKKNKTVEKANTNKNQKK